MRKFLLLVLAMPFLSSCRATMETRLSKSNPNAPINEINGGIISYLDEGAKWVKEKRRADAYKKMHAQCQGPYKIVEEGERLGAGSAIPIGGILFYGQEHHWNIRFECVQGV